MAFLKDRTQVRNPKSGEYILIDTENGKILVPSSFLYISMLLGER